MTQLFRIPNFCGGINLTDNPHYIGDNVCIKTKNLIPVGNNFLGRRHGFYSAFYGNFPFTGIASYVKSMKYMPDFGKLFIIVNGSSSDKFYTADIGNYGTLSNVQEVGASLNRPAGKFYTYAKIGTAYYIADGEYHYIMKFDGTNLIEITDPLNDLSHYKPKFVIEFRDRLFLVNYAYDNVVMANYVAYSNVLEPETIPSTSVLIIGEKPITATSIFTFTTATETVESQLFVSNSNELYVVKFIDTPQSVEQLNKSTGCVYPESVCNTPYGLVFANGNGIYIVGGNGETNLISQPINKYITNEAHVEWEITDNPLIRDINYGITCFYYDKFLIATYRDMETTLGTTTSSFWLDMKQTKSWYGEQDINVICYENVDGYLLAGCVMSGDILRYNDSGGSSANYNDGYYDISGNFYQSFPETEIVTKYYGMDNEFQDKIFRKIGMQVFNTYDTKLRIGTILNGESKDIITELTIPRNLTGSKWDEAKFDEDVFYTEIGGGSAQYRYFSNRCRGKTIALRIIEKPTYAYRILYGGTVISYLPTGRVL